MHRHTERFVAWFDPFANGPPRWLVIDMEHNDPATSSGKEELARVRNYETAHSLAMDLESQ